MKKNLILSIIFFLFCSLYYSTEVSAFSMNKEKREGLLNKLLAPGPLILGHDDLEKKDCLKCHTMGAGIPDAKCIACHKEIETSLKNPTSLHSKNKTTGCYKCHPDHKGREYDSVIIDQKTFDHKQTSFALEGKHQKIDCNKCHTQKREKKASRQEDPSYLGLKNQGCIKCHEKEDKHHFTGEFAKKDCDSCHNQLSWKNNINFDHNDTKFKLIGKHNTIECIKCHVNKNTPTKDLYFVWSLATKSKCLDCHADKDVHFFKQADLSASDRKRLEKCQSCHNENDWKKDINFDHNLDTKWKIRGKHKEVTCKKCHLSQNVPIYFFPKLLTDNCKVCHKDPHIGKFKGKNAQAKCTNCHTEEDWNKIRKDFGTFNHDLDTPFILDGAHKKINCNDCHKKDPFDKQQVFHFENERLQFCISCHKNIHDNKLHDTFLEKSCAYCHNTTTFKSAPNFDHNKSRFKIDGAHKKIERECKKCHPSENPKLPSHPTKNHALFIYKNSDDNFCVTCHGNQHLNQFKTLASHKCTECHSTETFEKLKQFDHSLTNFPLREKHNKTSCGKCHEKLSTFYPRPYETHPKRNYHFSYISSDKCISCHKDKHNGEFGKLCLPCHNETSFKKANDYHKNFMLSGVHFTLQCKECHLDDRLLAGISDNCQVCHTKDDVHAGQLYQCDECHSQFFWEVTNFRHTQTNFPLMGMHRTLECDECHPSGRFDGIHTDCINCHQKEKATALFPNHALDGFEECGECHNQFSFEKARE